jgi:hypothetical protein
LTTSRGRMPPNSLGNNSRMWGVGCVAVFFLRGQQTRSLLRRGCEGTPDPPGPASRLPRGAEGPAGGSSGAGRVLPGLSPAWLNRAVRGREGGVQSAGQAGAAVAEWRAFWFPDRSPGWVLSARVASVHRRPPRSEASARTRYARSATQPQDDAKIRFAGASRPFDLWAAPAALARRPGRNRLRF